MIFFKDKKTADNSLCPDNPLEKYQPLLNINNTSVVLDYAGNQFRFIDFLCAAAKHVYALDRDSEILKSLAQTFQQQNLTPLLSSQIHSLPNEALTHIICITTPPNMLFYEFLHDFYHFGRLLKKDGKLLLDFVDFSGETSFFSMLNELHWFRERNQDINDMSLPRTTAYHPEFIKTAAAHLKLELAHQESFEQKGNGWGPFLLKWRRMIFSKS